MLDFGRWLQAIASRIKTAGATCTWACLWLLSAPVWPGDQTVRAAFDEPVPIAELRIDPERTPKDGLTSEFIEISRPDNAFAAVLLSTVTGALSIKGLRVTGADGQTRDIVVDTLLQSAAAPIEVPLADVDVAVRRLEVLYRRPLAEAGGASTVVLKVAGRRLDAAPASPIQTPAVEATAARLVKLVSRSIDLSRADIVLDIGQDVGTIGLLQIRTPDLPVIVRQIRVTFTTGTSREIKIGQLIEAGGVSRPIDIAAAGDGRQRIRSVMIEVRPRTANETGVIEIWGDPPTDRSDVASTPSLPPDVQRRPKPRPEPQIADAEPDPERAVRRPTPDRRGDERKWKLLGTTTDDPGRRSRSRRAVFSIRQVAGEITAIRFLPRRDVVRLAEARAFFADGREQRLDVRGFELEPGQMTDELSVRGGDVVRVEVVYRAMDAFVGPAVLELWARVEGQDEFPSGRVGRRERSEDGRPIYRDGDRPTYSDGPLPNQRPWLRPRIDIPGG